MIILSKLADYGVIVATQLAATPQPQVNAMTLAAEVKLPPTTVAKVLKLLARAGIVTAVRGAAGGYRLARDAHDISVGEVVAAIDGALAMTQCTSDIGPCERLQFCPTRPHWHRINQAVEAALERIPLAEMTPVSAVPHAATVTSFALETAPLETTAS
ncbi:MAG TPA: SUF system Fe-S cluster assembly regulator [Stellaceae bacterium]|nr:SUF system Fe-S cluster assembly regulator [Stellaceae bacterium]